MRARTTDVLPAAGTVRIPLTDGNKLALPPQLPAGFQWSDEGAVRNGRRVKVKSAYQVAIGTMGGHSYVIAQAVVLSSSPTACSLVENKVDDAAVMKNSRVIKELLWKKRTEDAFNRHSVTLRAMLQEINAFGK